ncbi:hypothetical protein ERJ75_000204800 [Trypanosoma vivax]|uniref:Uncharacterized protein n=1 Tax=Trypanosoma vivax (strain Y486) TaxID=1055687 RepID=G0UA20_TRYVY|nr:hypothetical protein TRVL_06218 [Trypanosoma vivax]KAH8619097.1 hypothetical protein ERJ75_000204800 [Trypanosoma vivax]CCC52651.1 conserved hypothetical protein [Trypanosoma vivax Y486]
MNDRDANNVEVVIVDDASTTSSPTKQASNKRGSAPVNHFLLINGILCRTEAPDASFRPSDVFVGLDPPPRGTTTLGSASVDNQNSIYQFHSESVSRDCSIFNTFGVLSGGIIVDPQTLRFMDFTDDMIFQPPTFGDDAENCWHYDNLSYWKIRANAMASLMSTIHPMNAPGTEESPLPWPRSMPRLRCSRVANSLARQSVDRMGARLAVNVVFDPTKLGLVEEFRHHLKLTFPQTTFLPGEIPYRFQHGGRTLRSWAENAGHCNNTLAVVEIADSNGRRPVDSERAAPVRITSTSPFSEFHTFTGLPKMIFRRYREAIKRDLRSGLVKKSLSYAQRIEMRVQNVFHPIRKNLQISDRTAFGKRRKGYKRHWNIFHRYFTLLRAKPCLTCGNPNCNVWHFGADDDVDYVEKVAAFEEAKKIHRSDKVNSAVVSDAWDWFLLNEKEELQQRLGKIVRAIKAIKAQRKKLTSEC